MTIDFVHDLVCPWCRIGLANLRTAISSRPEFDTVIRFRPYQLNPGVPVNGIDYQRYIEMIAESNKTDRAGIEGRIRAAGDKAGLTFNFDKITKMPNSLLAHTLSAAAGEADRPKVIDAVHKAYWEDGRDVGDLETLIAIAGECGLDTVAMRAALGYPDLQKRVAGLAEQLQKDGVEQVPFFVINDTLTLAGAYQPAQLVAAMDKAAELVAEGIQPDGSQGE